MKMWESALCLSLILSDYKNTHRFGITHIPTLSKNPNP